MPNHSSKRPTDINQLGKSIVDQATAEPKPAPVVIPDPAGKLPAAVELGRRGGLKGGKARAESMTPERRAETAKKAAAARWNKN